MITDVHIEVNNLTVSHLMFGHHEAVNRGQHNHAIE